MNRVKVEPEIGGDDTLPADQQLPRSGVTENGKSSGKRYGRWEDLRTQVARNFGEPMYHSGGEYMYFARRIRF